MAPRTKAPVVWRAPLERIEGQRSTWSIIRCDNAGPEGLKCQRARRHDENPESPDHTAAAPDYSTSVRW